MIESTKPQSLGRTLLTIGPFEWHPRICFFAPFSWWSCCCAFIPMAVGSLACHLADFYQSWAFLHSGEKMVIRRMMEDAEFYIWKFSERWYGQIVSPQVICVFPWSKGIIYGPVFLMNLRTLGNCQVCRLCGPWPDVRLRDWQIFKASFGFEMNWRSCSSLLENNSTTHTWSIDRHMSQKYGVDDVQWSIDCTTCK